MKDTYDANIEALRAEARQYEQQTGRPVEMHEEYIETSDGKRTRSFGYKIKPRSVREAVGMLLAYGLKPQRDEDGVVRLHWDALEKEAQARPGADPRKHIEVTSWPIRSEDTLGVISYVLFEKGWDGFAPRDLRQTARILEGHAFKFQEPVDISVLAEKSSLLAALLHHFTVQPGPWQGTATELLEKLKGLGEIEQKNWVKAPDWPKNGHGLSLELTRIARWLRDEGITFTRDKHKRERRICLRDGYVEVIDSTELAEVSDQLSVISDDDADAAPVARPEAATGVVSVENSGDALPEKGPHINEPVCDASPSNRKGDLELRRGIAPGDAGFRGSSIAKEAVSFQRSAISEDGSSDPSSEMGDASAEVEVENDDEEGASSLTEDEEIEIARLIAETLRKEGLLPTQERHDQDALLDALAEYRRRHRGEHKK